MSFLLDTDVCSAYLRGDRRVWQPFMQYQGQLQVSAITAAELFAWALRRKAPAGRLNGVLDLLKDTTFLEVDHNVSRRFGELRAQQLDQGRATPPMDLLIAATALVHGLTLVTHNIQHFAPVPNLAIADWLVP